MNIFNMFEGNSKKTLKEDSWHASDEGLFGTRGQWSESQLAEYPAAASVPADSSSAIPGVGETSELPNTAYHRVGATLLDPNSSSVTGRKEPIQKTVRVKGDAADAVERAKKHFKKKGYRVVDAWYIEGYDIVHPIDEWQTAANMPQREKEKLAARSDREKWKRELERERREKEEQSKQKVSEGKGYRELAEILYDRLESEQPDAVSRYGHEVVGDTILNVVRREFGESNLETMYNMIAQELEARAELDEAAARPYVVIQQSTKKIVKSGFADTSAAGRWITAQSKKDPQFNAKDYAIANRTSQAFQPGGSLSEEGRGAGYPKTPRYKVGDKVLVKNHQGVGEIKYIKHRGDVGVLIKEPSAQRVVTTIDDLSPARTNENILKKAKGVAGRIAKTFTDPVGAADAEYKKPFWTKDLTKNLGKDPRRIPVSSIKNENTIDLDEAMGQVQNGDIVQMRRGAYYRPGYYRVDTEEAVGATPERPWIGEISTGNGWYMEASQLEVVLPADEFNTETIRSEEDVEAALSDELDEMAIDVNPNDPNNPTIHSHQGANPMSLKGRIMQARAQLKDLAKMSDAQDLATWQRIVKLAQGGGMTMGLEQNLEQILHGIEQLSAKRRKGGIGARGIEAVDETVVNEYLTPVKYNVYLVGKNGKLQKPTSYDKRLDAIEYASEMPSAGAIVIGHNRDSGAVKIVRSDFNLDVDPATQKALKTQALEHCKSGIKETITKVKGGYEVKSKKGKNLGGPYKSKKQAVKRLGQVEYFKHHTTESKEQRDERRLMEARLEEMRRAGYFD